MKKSLATHIIVLIIAVFLGAYLASLLTTRRLDIIKIGGRISKAPMGGFNKFASDIQWMLFINYCGGLNAVKKENVDEIYKRLNAILANDPNHEMAYEMGGMMFSVRDPQKAVDIFTCGTNNPNLQKNWKLPFYAGFVMVQHMTDQDDPERLKKAEEMFRTALARESSMPYIFSAMIRTRAKRLLRRKEWKGVPVVNTEHAYLCALFEEWRKGGNIELGSGEDRVFSGSAATVNDLQFRILEAVQQAKASAPANKHVLRTINEVVKKVLKDDHLCPKCLHVYAPGDKFCSHCGTAVDVYGICPRCRTVLKGKFCFACGYPGKGIAPQRSAARKPVAKPVSVIAVKKTVKK
ncbi:MAG: zinc ribbon domain-containing protein [Victivallales bacterium]|nr:zinc ribbon domain-containing protein [Victivallales bacterium]